MNRTIAILAICTLLLTPALSAGGAAVCTAAPAKAAPQSLKLTGSVRDAQGAPVVGATILVKGTNTGTTSGVDGNFSTSLPYAEATITVSFIGYAPQEIPVASRTRIDIVMVEDSKALEDVVVVGYNVQRKATITGSIATVTTKDLKQSPTANINNALAGRMPGLMVNQFSGGEPGNDVSQVNIRGLATYGSKDVITIVDGIERDMSYLAADEIETLTILKDASATAPYGIRGANGVIVVTTKRGRIGEKPTVDFKASVGVSEPIKFPSYLGSADYATLYNEAIRNDNPGLDPTKLDLFSAQAITNYRNARGDNSDGLGYDYDYFDYAFRPSVTQDYSISVRGGTERVRYFILGNYFHQGGNYHFSTKDNDNSFSRYNFRANVDVNATKRLRISVDLGARITDFTYPGASANNIIELANTQPPYLPIHIYNNNNGINDADFENNGGSLLYADDEHRYNMYGQLARSGYSTRTRRYINGSFKLSHDLDFITKGLSVEAQFSYDAMNGHTKAHKVNTKSIANYTYPGYATWKLDGQGVSAWKNDPDYWVKNGIFTTANNQTIDAAPSSTLSNADPEGTSRLQARLDYARTFGQHNVSAMMLWYQQSKIIGNQIPFRYTGLAVRATYSYANKYLAEFNLGYNGSENFAPGMRFGVFPAGSLGWVISRENFMKNVKWINMLKLRGSYGLVGSDQVGKLRFAYLQTYKYGEEFKNYFGETLQSYETAYEEGIFANSNLTWEKARKFNIGLDASLFGQRLTFSLDYFREHRYDIITDLSGSNKLGFPYIVGQKAPLINSGIVDNHGFEVEVGWTGNIGRHVRYYLKPNVTFARNKVVFANEIAYVDGNGRHCTWRQETGKRIGEHIDYIFDHFVADQDEANMLNAMNGGSGFGQWGTVGPGDVVYKDLNGDGVVNNYDRAATGNPRMPELQFGLPLGIQYKNFDFSMLFQGSALCSVQLSYAAVWDFPLFDQNRVGKVKQMHMQRWTPETAATAKYPALHYGVHNNNKNSDSDLFLYNATYVRLKNVEIGYSLPKRWLAKANIQNVRFYVQGLNLLTIDNLGDIDYDPEVQSGGGSWFPIQRVYNFGVNVTF
ncbi:MAG: TonB-dependent receptor [Alistipes sp.]